MPHEMASLAVHAAEEAQEMSWLEQQADKWFNAAKISEASARKAWNQLSEANQKLDRCVAKLERRTMALNAARRRLTKLEKRGEIRMRNG
jgi:hypothetical protein